MTNQFITYKTTSIADSYLLLKNNFEIGKLHKSAWFGAVIEASLYDTKILFKATGSVNPTIDIIDEFNDQKIGTIKIHNSFVFFPKADLSTVDGSNYQWQSNGIFNYSWEWKKDERSNPVLFSMESYHISNKVGQIASQEQIVNKDLLIIAGLHLRDLVNRETLLTKIVGLVAVIMLLTMIFLNK